MRQPKNIFDEIYQETAKNYLGYYNFNDLKNVTVKNRKLYDSNMNETDKYESIITYDDSSLGSDVKNLELRFNFDGSSKGVNIWFERYANSGEKINFVIHYEFNKKVLVKKIMIYKNRSETMPSNWWDIQTSREYTGYKDTNNDNDGFKYHFDEVKLGEREAYLSTGGKATGTIVEGDSYDPGKKYIIRVAQAGWVGSGRNNDGFVPLEPFRYTRKNATVSTVGKLSGTVTIDVPIGATSPYNPGADGNIRPVKVVYKYKETFTQDPPGKPNDTDIPNEADVKYLKDPNPPVAKPLPTPPTPKNVPNEPAKIPQPTPPVPEKVPEYAGDGKKPPVKPVKPTLPTKPVEPTKPPKDGIDGDRPNHELDLPDLPTPPEKPILPNKPVVNKPEGQKFRVHKTEYEFVPTTYFEDESGNRIIPNEDGDKPKRDIPGYSYIRTITDKDGNKHHIYKKVQILTHWIDKEGNRLQGDKPGKYPDNDGVSDIPGYRLIEVRNEPNGDVTNIYTKVRTYFKDPNGHDIIPPEDGENPKKDIPGYEYVGTKKDKDGNVVHVYRKITEVTHWIDKEGNKLQNDKPGKHPDNDGVSDISGYRLVNVRNEQNGDISNIYTKVRTYFKDPDGHDIIPPEDGENPKKDIPGYRYVESKKDKDGNAVHVYQKVKTHFRDTDGKEIIPVEDGEIAKKDIPGYTYLRTEKDKDGNVIHVYKKNPSGKKLPETGDPASLMGIGLGSLIAGRRLRRKNK